MQKALPHFNQFNPENQYNTKSNYKILIIQSITNKYYSFIDLNNSLGLLPLSSKVFQNYSTVRSQKKTVKEKIQPASMAKTISCGKALGFTLDCYFLSTDYGLIPEHIIVPNFECTRRLKFSDFITKRVQELEISKSLDYLLKYDLVYLDVVEDQIQLLDSKILKRKGSEIVYFTDNLYIAPPFLGFNLRELKKTISNRSFIPVPIRKDFKANLLLNYLIIKLLFKKSTFLQFIQTLQEVLSYY